MRELREHQTRAITSLRQALASGSRRPLLQAPTGFGKTLLSAAIIRSALAKGKRVLFVVPALTLIDQTVREFYEDGIRDVGVIQADHPMTNSSRPVQVASIQTLQRRELPEVDLVIIDEAHRVFDFVAEWMEHPDWLAIPFIGLSATPWTKGLGRLYDKLIIAATTADLIEAGFLSKFQVFAPSHPDLRGVRTVAGDYHEGDLSRVMSDKVLTADIVATWLAKARDQPTLCFGVDRVHAKTLHYQFEAAGINCGYVDAETPRDEREVVRKKFASGEFPVVCNIGVLTTGVDWDVRCIILARPTKSEILLTQIIGRGLRTAPGKDHLVILDHSDSTLRLGFVTDIHHERMDGGALPSEAKVSAQEAEKPKPRECPSCHYVRAPKLLSCPSCGHIDTVHTSVKVVAGELVEMGAQRKANKDDWDMKIYFMRHLKAYALRSGKAEGWVAHKYRAKFGVWPNDPRVKYVGPAPAEIDPTVKSWIMAQNIKFAKSRAGARHAHG